MTISADARLLQQTSGFRDLDPAALESLLASAGKRPIAAGQTLFDAGQPFLGEVYFVRRGAIELHRPDGRVEAASPGFLVGLSSYLGDSPYASKAVARVDSEMLVVTASDLRAAEGRHATLSDAINRLIGKGLRARGCSSRPAGGELSRSAASIMSSPLSTCSPRTSLRDALDTMLRHKIGSLVVVETTGRPCGIVTFRTIAQRLAEPGIDAVHDPVTNALQPVVTIANDLPLWQIQDVQERERSKYLVVADQERAVGMLSQTDLVRELRASQSNPYALIGAAESLAELAGHFLDIDRVAAGALETNRRARIAIRILSDTHLAIQRRCVELTVAEHEAQGHGSAPIPFALIIMGSGGRKEMMLDPDQDNGLILADHPPAQAKSIDAWFAGFSDRLNVNLDRVGYILCPGDIMARNPMYRKSLSEWKSQITKMTRRPNETVARWSNIVFDFNTQYGEDTLAQQLRAHVNAELEKNPGLLKFMVEDDAQGRAPINWFNHLVTSSRSDGAEVVDVKRNGMRIVANAARIFALKSGVSVCNTSERLDALVRKGIISADFGATVASAYDELLDILLTHQLEQRRSGTPLDKEVSPHTLSAPARESLRVSMRAVKRFQERLQGEFGIALF